MEVSTERKEPVLIITIKGKLGAFFGVKELQDALKEQLDDKINFILLDMKDVPYLSSSGIRILLETRRKLRQKEGALVLFGLQPACHEILKVTGIIPELPVTATRAEAEQLVQPPDNQTSRQ